MTNTTNSTKATPAKAAAATKAKAPAKAVAPTAEAVAQVVAKKLHPATFYRVGTRVKASEAGWTFTQIATGTDRYERDGVVVDIHHGPSNLMVAAEKTEGDAHDSIRDGQLKLEKAAVNYLGLDVPLTGWYMPKAERAALKIESGRGFAKIEVIPVTA